MYEEEVVTAEDSLSLIGRLEQQRRVIGAMAEVLDELGFDLADIADIAEPQTETPPKRGCSVYCNVAAGGYLLLNLLSPRVPGPASWLGLGHHVMLLRHADVVVDALVRHV